MKKRIKAILAMIPFIFLVALLLIRLGWQETVVFFGSIIVLVGVFVVVSLFVWGITQL